jgi:hypothetical protein
MDFGEQQGPQEGSQEEAFLSNFDTFNSNVTDKVNDSPDTITRKR